MESSALGRRVLLQRRARDLTQAELGRRTAIGANTIARLERGEIQALLSDKVVRLAEALDTSTDWLLGRIGYE